MAIYCNISVSIKFFDIYHNSLKRFSAVTLLLFLDRNIIFNIILFSNTLNSYLIHIIFISNFFNFTSCFINFFIKFFKFALNLFDTRKVLQYCFLGCCSSSHPKVYFCIFTSKRMLLSVYYFHLLYFEYGV